MQHNNSVFHSLQKHIPWAMFDQLVEKYKADKRVRRLDTRGQFLERDNASPSPRT